MTKLIVAFPNFTNVPKFEVFLLPYRSDDLQCTDVNIQIQKI